MQSPPWRWPTVRETAGSARFGPQTHKISWRGQDPNCFRVIGTKRESRLPVKRSRPYNRTGFIQAVLETAASLDSWLDSWLSSVMAVHVAKVLARGIHLIPVPVSPFAKPADRHPVAGRQASSGGMDRYGRFLRGDNIRRLTAWAQHVEVSEDFNRVRSIQNDICLHLALRDPHGYAVRNSYTMEGRMAHESRYGSQGPGKSISRDCLSRDYCTIVSDAQTML